jgi:hypothetical protein
MADQLAFNKIESAQCRINMEITTATKADRMVDIVTDVILFNCIDIKHRNDELTGANEEDSIMYKDFNCYTDTLETNRVNTVFTINNEVKRKIDYVTFNKNFKLGIFRLISNLIHQWEKKTPNAIEQHDESIMKLDRMSIFKHAFDINIYAVYSMLILSYNAQTPFKKSKDLEDLLYRNRQLANKCFSHDQKLLNNDTSKSLIVSTTPSSTKLIDLIYEFSTQLAIMLADIIYFDHQQLKGNHILMAINNIYKHQIRFIDPIIADKLMTCHIDLITDIKDVMQLDTAKAKEKKLNSTKAKKANS